MKTSKIPLLTDFEVVKVVELNLFSLKGTSTGNTSNKFYHIELHVGKSSNKCQLYSMYGPTGKVQVKEWRHYNDKSSAEKDFNSIVKSKLRKGYVEVELAQRVIGSSEAQKITKPVVLKNTTESTDDGSSKLHAETARIISNLMGSTNTFVIQTLKCPLGQLTNDQIDNGRSCLNQANDILNANKTLSDSDKKELETITNKFYSLIPHNLGAGARGQLINLLLDTKDKINQKEYDLDTLLDAKAIGATISSSVFDQYTSLDTTFNFIEHEDSLFKWINSFIQETRASNHKHLGTIKLLNAWDIQRTGEKKLFEARTKEIAKECGKSVFPDQMEKLVKSRKDIPDIDLYKKANVMPLFHGTRTQNITGILKKGILIRPSGVVINGAMYGNGIYMGKSSKSVNYTSINSSYYASSGDDRAFLFIADCALGKQEIASYSHQYSLNNIRPNHSVWAKGGKSGVINDEFILYRQDQHNLRYLIEFTCTR